MSNDEYVKRENERAKRLFDFVRGELQNMYVGSRLDFTLDLFNYLAPEIKILIKDRRISPEDVA